VCAQSPHPRTNLRAQSLSRCAAAANPILVLSHCVLRALTFFHSITQFAHVITKSPRPRPRRDAARLVSECSVTFALGRPRPFLALEMCRGSPHALRSSESDLDDILALSRCARALSHIPRLLCSLYSIKEGRALTHTYSLHCVCWNECRTHTYSLHCVCWSECRPELPAAHTSSFMAERGFVLNASVAAG
jgi:hypothetical protein